MTRVTLNYTYDFHSLLLSSLSCVKLSIHDSCLPVSDQYPAGRLRSLVEYTVQNGTIPQGVNNKSICEHSTLHLQITATNAGVRFPDMLYLPAEVMKMGITFFQYATVTRTTSKLIAFLH